MKTAVRYSEGEIPILDVVGEIDVVCVPDLRKEIIKLIDSGTKNIVFNLRDVTYIDSSGLGILIMAIRKIKALHNDSGVSLVGIDPHVKQIFELTRVDQFFDFFDDEDECIRFIMQKQKKNSNQISVVS